MTIEIELNGKPRAIAPHTSVADLVRELGVRPEIVAVEVNQRLVARDRRDAYLLAAGDRVELVTLVGGG